MSGCRSRQLAPWPARTHGQHTDRVLGATQSRGFNVLMWRDGDLCRALVSDAEPAVLSALARRLGARD